ncbi:site-2 protease family protein [Thermococcus sp. Bubb.Bath]|uniref:site-2 protease family protein n=1 Tax=Thermococcus sp. Bubb.Bath TaxID=1638242 RepID=UPI001438A393|nr:site-2 protease family protein [Thermococcus sp. Bubb.Bath]NJF25135.1 PDZ domain-containing protein [Thermococcus sp. Bubb.Bath]
MVSMLITALVVITVLWLVVSAVFRREGEPIDEASEETAEKEEGLSVDLFVAMWRTKHLLGFIDRTASRAKRFWRAYGDAGIVIGFAGMAYVFYVLFKMAIKAVEAGGKQAGVQLVIPGITIPLWYGIIGLIVVMVVHELSHGVVARADNLPLKSVGLVLFYIIPGAFVEPDEEALKKAPLRSRLRVYGAGSLANIVTALIAVLLINFAVTPLLQPAGIEVGGVVDNGPAHGLLMKGDIITAINGHSVTTMNEFIKIMNATHPGEVITLTVLRNGEEKTVKVTLGKYPNDPKKGFIGIYPIPHYVSKVGYDSVLFPTFFSLYWIYVLNLGIGLMNLFPLIPLDGGRMLDDVLKEYLPKGIVNPVRYTAIGVGLTLLALNLWPAIMNLAG